jgi:acetyltransferase-like isoleucine patch superfamily enzyme
VPPFSLRDAVCVRLVRLLLGRRFKGFGTGVRIVSPLDIIEPENISIGNDVYVGHQTTLAAVPLTGSGGAALTIGEGTHIGSFNHIYCTRRISIGRNVLTANGVYISDNLHEYADKTKAVIHQPIRQIGDVEIGDGAWLGHNCCIIGVRIGCHAVIGANAVVTRDVPDFAVAAGVPAVIIKRFDDARQSWRSTDADGTFLD